MPGFRRKLRGGAGGKFQGRASDAPWGMRAARRSFMKRKADRKYATMGMVKRILHQNAETKFVGDVWANSIKVNCQMDGNIGADFLKLVPALPLGTTDNTRLGNKVTPRGLKVQITVAVNTSEGGAKASDVLLPRILCMSLKSQKYTPSVVPDWTRVLDYGAGEHAFSGSLYDVYTPINKDVFTVHKDIRTKVSAGTLEQDTARVRTYTFWIRCPKVLNYADGQTFPQNFAPFISVGYANSDGTTNVDTLGLQVTCQSTLYYEDA